MSVLTPFLTLLSHLYIAHVLCDMTRADISITPTPTTLTAQSSHRTFHVISHSLRTCPRPDLTSKTDADPTKELITHQSPHLISLEFAVWDGIWRCCLVVVEYISTSRRCVGPGCCLGGLGSRTGSDVRFFLPPTRSRFDVVSFGLGLDFGYWEGGRPWSCASFCWKNWRWSR